MKKKRRPKRPISSKEYLEKKYKKDAIINNLSINENFKEENLKRMIGFFSKATVESIQRATLLEREQFNDLLNLISNTPSFKASQIFNEKKSGSNSYGNKKYFNENGQENDIAICANNLANMFSSNYGYKKFVLAKDEHNLPTLCYLNNLKNEENLDKLELLTISGAESFRAKGEKIPEELGEIPEIIDSFAKCIEGNVMNSLGE